MVAYDCRFLLHLNVGCSGGRHFDHANSGEQFGHAHTSGARTLCLEGVILWHNVVETYDTSHFGQMCKCQLEWSSKGLEKKRATPLACMHVDAAGARSCAWLGVDDG